MNLLKNLLRAVAFALAAVAAVACGNKAPAVKPAIAPDAAVEAKVEQVLKGMTLEEKAGQLVQLSIGVISAEGKDDVDPAKMDVIFGKYKVGSILNVMNDHALDREQTAAFISKIQESSMKHIGIPCIYGLDMIHGASYLVDGSFYPQEINLGAHLCAVSIGLPDIPERPAHIAVRSFAGGHIDGVPSTEEHVLQKIVCILTDRNIF